jgi:hypothetical protein
MNLGHKFSYTLVWYSVNNGLVILYEHCRGWSIVLGAEPLWAFPFWDTLLCSFFIHRNFFKSITLIKLQPSHFSVTIFRIKALQCGNSDHVRTAIRSWPKREQLSASRVIDVLYIIRQFCKLHTGSFSPKGIQNTSGISSLNQNPSTEQWPIHQVTRTLINEKTIDDGRRIDWCIRHVPFGPCAIAWYSSMPSTEIPRWQLIKSTTMQTDSKMSPWI